MTTYCILCRSIIPEKRQRRMARTCSPDCQRSYRRQYLQERAKRVCKACGRTLPRKRRHGAGNSVPGACPSKAETGLLPENRSENAGRTPPNT